MTTDDMYMVSEDDIVVALKAAAAAAAAATTTTTSTTSATGGGTSSTTSNVSADKDSPESNETDGKEQDISNKSGDLTKDSMFHGLLFTSCAARGPADYIKFMSRYQVDMDLSAYSFLCIRKFRMDIFLIVSLYFIISIFYFFMVCLT